MSGFSRNEETRLLELLGKELELLERIRALTKEQSELIAADDIEAFDMSLDHRQEFIEEINGLHPESNILMQSYAYNSNSGGFKRSAGIEAAAGKFRDILTECSGLSEKNEALAKKASEHQVKRIDELVMNRKSLGSYIQTVSNEPEMFDRRT